MGEARQANAVDAWTRSVQQGDFAAAWQISDAVLRARVGVPCWHLPRHQQWLWNGDPLAGKRVLIHCFHGLGDTIQFVRYAPAVRALAAEVIVWVQPALLGLLRGTAGVDRWLPLHDGVPDVRRDADVEIMELPHVFRSTLRTLPAQVPYLHVSPSAGFDPSRYHVGLAWQAGDWDTARSVPLGQLAALGEIPGVTLHALQRGPALEDWRDGFGPISGSDDAVSAARAMQALDLVISVDSFPAHLAGALGRPVWTLLHAAPDWRWLVARDDSPWYPTMCLFRQERPGDWQPVIARVAAALRRLASGQRGLGLDRHA